MQRLRKGCINSNLQFQFLIFFRPCIFTPFFLPPKLPRQSNKIVEEIEVKPENQEEIAEANVDTSIRKPGAILPVYSRVLCLDIEQNDKNTKTTKVNTFIGLSYF